MKKVICYTVGEARGNPGPAAIGVYITDIEGQMIDQQAQTIGNATSNFAEYYAVMVGLQALQSLYANDTQIIDFELCLSSEVVKKQLNAEAPINEPGMVPMFIEIHNIRVESFPNLVISLVTTDQNRLVATRAQALLDDKR